jgi:hypothetical protein
LTLEPEPTEGTSEPIDKLAISLKIDCLTSGGLALHALASDGDCRAPPRQLALAFAQTVGAANVGYNLAENVGEKPTAMPIIVTSIADLPAARAASIAAKALASAGSFAIRDCRSARVGL